MMNCRSKFHALKKEDKKIEKKGEEKALFFLCKKGGMKMAYIFIPDITSMSKEVWRQERKKGIGGSDVGAILGVNKFRSVSVSITIKSEQR